MKQSYVQLLRTLTILHLTFLNCQNETEHFIKKYWPLGSTGTLFCFIKTYYYHRLGTVFFTQHFNITVKVSIYFLYAAQFIIYLNRSILAYNNNKNNY